MSEYCTNCKDMADKLAAANARVAALEKLHAEVLEQSCQNRAMLCDKLNQRDRKLIEMEAWLNKEKETTRKQEQRGDAFKTQLTALREAVAGVIACADMPTADNKEEVIKNFHAFIAAIERLRREVGG